MLKPLGAWCLLASLLTVAPTAAQEAARADDGHAPASPVSQRPRGRPTIKLDRLDFPKDVPNAWYFRKELRKFLRQQARRMNWGAGRGSTITFRFAVQRLVVVEQDGILRVSCTAVGRLPKGKTAKGSLSFGADPRRRNREVVKVLQIVARGVLTRLAELERVRRGDLDHSRVRRPVLVD